MEERLKGVPYKLSAIEDFLRKYPSYRDKICVIMLLTCAPCRGSDYNTTANDIRSSVENINNAYGNGKRIIYLCEESYFHVEKRMALWSVADLYFSTPLRDGLHLIALEYVYVRKNIKKPGVVLISELTGCARLLNGSIRVNPFRTAEITSSLHYILDKMTNTEREMRQQKNEESFKYNTASQWASTQLNILKNIDQSNSGVLVGLGLGNHLIHLKANFKHLRYEDIRDDYSNAKNRLILLDYGGTLFNTKAESKLDSSKLKDNDVKNVHNILEKLSTALNNNVFVISGRLVDELKSISFLKYY